MPSGPYDGLGNPEVLRGYLERMAAEKVEMLINLGNESSDPSWRQVQDNTWYQANIRRVAKAFVSMCDPARPPVFLWGLEMNDHTRRLTRFHDEHQPPNFEMSPESLWGWRGSKRLAEIVRDATGCEIWLHLDTDTWQPADGDGGTSLGDWGDWMADCGFTGIAYQHRRVGIPGQRDPGDDYYRDQTRLVSKFLHDRGLKFITAESCYPGCDPDRARRVAEITLENGADHSISG